MQAFILNKTGDHGVLKATEVADPKAKKSSWKENVKTCSKEQKR